MAIDNVRKLICGKPWLHNPEQFPDEMAAIDHEIGKLFAEIERLRAELTTTLIACERCGRGVRARYAVAGMCTECAEVECQRGLLASREYERFSKAWSTEHDKYIRLEEQVKQLESDRDHWRTEAERYQAALDDVQCRLYGGTD